ncbi:complement C2-like [Oculina patagonica]
MAFFTSVLIHTFILVGFSTYTLVAVPYCTGNQCDVTNCTSNPCKNASQCVDHTNGFSCVCKPGLTGKLCDVEYNECDSTPCQNGGTCAEGVNRFTCTCARGFTGVTCEKRTGDCTDPPSVANGKVRSTKSYALYTCNNGYKTIGLRFIRCNGGKWVGKPPTCQAKATRQLCQRPQGISHGYFEPQDEDFTVGSTVKYFCNDKYRLRGNVELTCTENGKWSPKQLPRCTKKTKCRDPGIPKHGRRDGSLFLEGTQVRFSCDEGYELVGLSSLRCVPLCRSCKTVRWNGTTPTCRKIDPLKSLKRVAESLREHFIDKLSWMTTDSLARAGLSSGAGGLDLVFVFDSSASVGDTNFKKGIAFAKTIIDEFGISNSSTGTRVAVVTFSSTAKVIFNLKTNAMPSKKEAIATLENLNFIAGGTATRLALNKTIEEIVPETRKRSKKALFLITDGRSNIGGDPTSDAMILRDSCDFEIYAIGVTDSVDEQELRSIASEPFRTHVFLLKNFEDLTKLKEMITAKGVDYSECGVAGDTQLRNEAEKNFRIVGGREAKPGAWPWQAAVFVKSNFRCGGALIKENWVVTVAHCFYYDGKVEAKDVTVVLGEHERFEEEGTEQNIRAKKLILHPNASLANLGDDLALIRLEHAVKFSPFVRTVCLPLPTDVFYVRPGKSCVIAGWGSSRRVSPDDLAGPPNAVLQQIQIKFVSHKNCRENATNAEVITDKVVCAGDSRGEKDACKGDSGSPLVVRRSADDSWAVVGLSSWGEGCATQGKYGVYTQLKNYMRWIKRRINPRKKDKNKNKD